MPTTVQQVETLPEGLATLEINPLKVPLIETNTETEVEKPKEEEKVAETPKEEEIPKIETKIESEPKVESELNVDLFETSKHIINCASEKFEKTCFEVNIVKEKQVHTHQKCYVLTVHDLGFDSKFLNYKKSE